MDRSYLIRDFQLKVGNGFDQSGYNIFCTLQVFETSDRDILLKKFEKYSVVDEENTWFGPYLKNRFQKVKVGNVFSKPKKVMNDVL